MMQPVLRPVRHSAARLLPAGSAAGGNQQVPCEQAMTTLPVFQSTYQNHQVMVGQNQQVMLGQPMFHDAQAMSGPFFMVVPGDQLMNQEGQAMVANGSAIPVMPMPMPQQWYPANYTPPGAWGTEVPQAQQYDGNQHWGVTSQDDGKQMAGGRRQRRRQRGIPGIGANDAAGEEELQQMRAAVGNMVNVKENSPTFQADLTMLKHVVGEVQAPSSEFAVFSCDTLPSMEGGASNMASCGGAPSGDSDCAENGFMDKAESERAIAKLSSGIPEEQQEIFEWITSSSDSMWLLAASRYGTRVIQKAFDVLGPDEKVVLVDGLRGHVQEALESPHANHVLQKVVETMPPPTIRFVVQEMLGLGAYFARRRFGCRVVERLLEHCPCSYLSALTEEILLDAEKLCRHPYGNFVMQHLLSHGNEEQKHVLAGLLRENIIRLARHRNASHVVEAAFIHCSDKDKQELMQAMEADASDLLDLSRTRCGSFVVREMIGSQNQLVTCE